MGKRSREALGETFPEGKSKKRKHEGKDGKEKKKRLRELKKDVVGLPEEEENVQADAPADAAENGEAEVLSKKAEKKKRRKMKEAQEDEAKDGSKGDEAGAEQAQAEAPEGDSKNEEAEQGVDEEEEAASGKKPRFIVFVGTASPSLLRPAPHGVTANTSIPRKPPLLRHGQEHRGALRAAAPDLGAVPQQARRPDQVPRVRVRRVLELQEHPDVPRQVAPLDVRGRRLEGEEDKCRADVRNSPPPSIPGVLEPLVFFFFFFFG